MMTPTTPKPSLTVAQLYDTLEAEAIKEGVRGEKGVKMKELALELSKEIGKKKLLFTVLFKMVQDRMDSPKRNHFMNICRKNWEVTEDDDGLTWVDLGRPKDPARIA